MISLFEKELIAMERELRDLKTYCRHGLGNTRFYSKEMTIDCIGERIYTFTATTKTGEPSPAFTTIYFSIPTPDTIYFTANEATETSRTLRFLPSGNTRIIVRAISTSDLTLTEEDEPYV